MRPRKPVTDWTTDWDHLGPRWRKDPYPIWDELRRSCPISHTERYQGAYPSATVVARRPPMEARRDARGRRSTGV